MTAAHRIVAVVDRHAWYVPAIEAEELARAGAKVDVSWAQQADRPPQTNAGLGEGETPEALSRISSAFVPPSITTEDRVIGMARHADGILVVRADITARVMDALPRLKVVGRYGIGLDNIDTAAADARGISVVYAPGFCAREVADHTMTMLLACSRKLEPLHRAMAENRWTRDTASPMRGLFTQTLGLIGLGQIGREVTKRAHAFGMRVVAYDPMVSDEDAQRLGVRRLPLNELLAEADFISLHAPLIASTRHLLGADQFARMKPTAFVLNTSRGPLIDEAAMAQALERRQIAGAALDVFEVEPLPANSSLRKFDNVLMTPHTGGLSDEGQILLRQTVAAAMADILIGNWPAGPELFTPRGDAARARAQQRLRSAAV
jgi:D-3-phosphoglycerate dehydrogenase